MKQFEFCILGLFLIGVFVPRNDALLIKRLLSLVLGYQEAVMMASVQMVLLGTVVAEKIVIVVDIPDNRRHLIEVRQSKDIVLECIGASERLCLERRRLLEATASFGRVAVEVLKT